MSRHLCHQTDRHRLMLHALTFLQQSKGAHPDGPTTFELQEWTDDMSPATTISELRELLKERGQEIIHTYAGTSAEGRRYHRYRLHEKRG